MKSLGYFLAGLALVLAHCGNMPMDDSTAFKAYPNPYNPAAGVLTLEMLDGSNFSETQNDLSVLDFDLQEVYRANVLPDTATKKKILWAGIDNTGRVVAPGVYYIKLMKSNATGTEGKDSLFKLVVK